ncbi:MAG: hypothetical protein ACEQSA_00070 [Weeksellaceae bacterium]
MLNQFTQHKIWAYLSETQKDLILEGKYVMEMSEKAAHQFKDYSFLVFPFAKAYEGFLKQLFLDVGFITHLDYISDHFRLGKFLSPHLTHKLGEQSLYVQVINHSSQELADKIWNTWKYGRNEIFHYYPHNLKRITLQGAEETNTDMLRTMIEAYEKLKQ